MTEPTVQVPVSLIKRAVEGLLRAPGRDAVLVCGELHALLSQPTPTAEPPRIERPVPTTAVWRDRHGDEWVEDAGSLMHSFETAPFPREYVEKKWGPLVPVVTQPAPSLPTREQIAEAIWDAMPFEAQEAMLTTDADEAADAVLALLSQPTPADQQPAVDRIQADLLAVAEPMEPGGLRTALLDIAEGDYSQPTPTAEPKPDHHLYRAVRLSDGFVAGPWVPGERAQIGDPSVWREEVYGPVGWKPVTEPPLQHLVRPTDSENIIGVEPPRIEDMAPGTTFTANRRGLADPEDFKIAPSGRILCRNWRLTGWDQGDHGIDPSTIRDVTPPTESTK